MDKITASALAAVPGITHGFFTRRGAPTGLITLHQVHSPNAIIVDQPWSPEAQPKADALVTNRPGLFLGVKTADCTPVLFADTQAGVVGAAHAGWRGALEGVLEDTVEKMVSLGADPAHIVAAVGPCIGKASYEVSAGFEGAFLTQDKNNIRFFTRAAKEGHLMFDLPGYVISRLEKLGIGAIEHVARDTVIEEADFFSHRRATLRGTEKSEGRQMSVIGIGEMIS